MSRARTPVAAAESSAHTETRQQGASEQQSFAVDDAGAGQRLDQFLVAHLFDVSRARVQQMIDQQCVAVTDANSSARCLKASGKLRAGDVVCIAGEVAAPAFHAHAEAIPLDIVFEDEYLAVINKPAGMMVHAGAGATEDARNQGTLVNALLHHMRSLSAAGGPLRPGIVHRLDKQTSGLIIVAKDDRTHRRLSELFAARKVHKTYMALVHGDVKANQGTVNASISRDHQRRTRMTTRGAAGRNAISHYTVRQRIESRYGPFTLLEVVIETGRTHQIRVHLSSMGHAVVGDTLYGAPARVLPRVSAPATRAQKEAAERDVLSLGRNFLHAAHLEFNHPQSGSVMQLSAPLPGELTEFLNRLMSGQERQGVEAPADKL